MNITILEIHPTGIARALPAGALTAAALLAGCVDSGSRLCNGFDHPTGMIWTGGDVEGSTRTYENADGSTVAYVLRGIEESGVRENRSNESDSEVTCIETADYRYEDDLGDVAFEMQFRQLEARADEPLQDQLVGLDLDIRNPAGTEGAPGPEFQFNLSDLDGEANNVNADTVVGRYVPSLGVGGVDYTDLLEQTILDANDRYSDSGTGPLGQWVRVLIARDTGPVQYELLDGSVFTLIDR